jgi:hypothetical protein
LAAFCAKHCYTGRRSPAGLLHRLPAEPADAVLALVTILKPLYSARKTSTDPSPPAGGASGRHDLTALPRAGVPT